MALGLVHVCPFCESANQPSLCSSCVNSTLRQEQERLAELLLVKERLQKQLAQSLKKKEESALNLFRREEASKRKGILRKRLQEESEQHEQERSHMEQLRIGLAAKASRMEHAKHTLEQTLRKWPSGTFGNGSDQQLLNQLVVVTTARKSQARSFLRVLKEIFPLRLAMSVPSLNANDAGALLAGGVRICGMRLPSSMASLSSLPPPELSTSLGYFLHLLDLTAKYLSLPLLHTSGFGVSVSRVWQRASYWSPAPSSLEDQYPLYRQGNGSSAPPPRSASGPLPGSTKGATGGREDQRSQPSCSNGAGARVAGSDAAWGTAERRASVGEGEWQGVDASAFSSASSLFESPSWHAVPAPPAPKIAPETQYRDPKAAPSGRGWAEDAAKDTSENEELRSLRHGLRLLLRSAACLCAAQGIPWTPRLQRHQASPPRQEHGAGSGLQQQMQAMGKGAQLDNAYGELFALMARLLSALTKEQAHSSAGGLPERGAGRWEGAESLSSSLMASAAWEEGSCIGPVTGATTQAHMPRASAGAGAGPCLEERHYLSCARPPAQEQYSADGGSVDGTPLGGGVLGSSLVLDYIPPPNAGFTPGGPQAAAHSGSHARQAAGPRRVSFLPQIFRGQGRPSPASGQKGEEDWDVVEPTEAYVVGGTMGRISLPPPPSSPVDVEHWTRAHVQ